MKRLFLLICALAFTAPTPVWADAVAFKDAFRAYVRMRQLDEELSLLSQRKDLDEGARATSMEKISAQVSEARIDFHAVLRSDGDSLNAWEHKVLEQAAKRPNLKAKAVDKEAISYLTRNFSKAHDWSPLEWQAVGEWFGQATQDSFFQSTFAGTAPQIVVSNTQTNTPVLWLNDPFSRFLSKDEQTKEKADKDRLRQQLKKQGYDLEDLSINYFSRLEDQAEEIHLALIRRTDDRPFYILSSGSASAVLLRAFDLNAELLARKEILGWLNLNGQLFGHEQLSPKRAPASESRADSQLSEAKHEFLLLRKERLGVQAPLGAKFPVMNLVTTAGKFRPTENLRESVIPEGRTFFVRDGNGFDTIQAALSSH